ncbi:hypothetical protein Q5P01_011099 [Channa striata]|uniref:Tenascin n=1 Tax=Channa striata TaxID=64152 RepID=A0AA88MSR1_CHASR|nr:hypothetical protein Q5P01_011099 [Channa striata]
MLFTIGLLLLLTPFPSIQTTTNEKRESTGSDVTKPNAVFPLSKQKSTAVLAKKTVPSALKPNTVNQTVSPTPATNQKPPTVNTTTTTKSKLNPSVIRTTPLPTVKATTPSGTVTNKDKHIPSVNQTAVIKSHSTNDVKNPKDKSAPNPVQTALSMPAKAVKSAATDKHNVTESANWTPVIRAQSSSIKSIKDKHQPLVNQTVSVKLPSSSEARAKKDNPTPTGTPNVQAQPTKSASTSGVKSAKEKLQPSVNSTVLVKSDSTNEVGASKDKPAPAGTSAKSTSVSGEKTVKEKLRPSVNQTVSDKSPSGSEVKSKKDKDAITGTPNVQSQSTKSASTSGGKTQLSVNQTLPLKDSEPKSTKDKPAPAGTPNNQSPSKKPVSGSGAKTSKEKLHPSFNETVSEKLPLTSAGKIAKDKAALILNQNIQATSTNSATASGAKTIKNKPKASVNETALAKPPLIKANKPALSAVQTGLSTPAKAVNASGSSSDKDKVTASANRTAVIKTPETTRENPNLSKPLKVVISNDCASSNTKEQELKLQPGAPLVMTHKISLLPSSCTGECETEMAALKGRVARLEREMSLIKEKCPCSGNCPDDCSGNGECEKGKCVCHQGFMGLDCKTVKGKTKENTQEKTTKVEHTPKKKTEVLKPKVATNAKPDIVRTQAKQDASGKKITTEASSNATKTSRPTVGQAFLKYDGRKLEEVRKGKPTDKPDQLKDEPHSNVTQTIEKKSNGTTISSKGLGPNKTKTGKETVEQSSLAEKNVRQSSEDKRSKTDKVDTTNVQSADNRNTDAVRFGKEKVTQESQYVVNPTVPSTSAKAQVLQNKTTVQGSVEGRGIGGSGLGSVRVVNISSYSFTITWLAPQGMFKNFTVIRREPRSEGDEDDNEEAEEEAPEAEKTPVAKNSTEVPVQTESTDTVGKTDPPRSKADTKRISIVVPGSVRSVEFSNLRANTRYTLQIYGSATEKRSKIHRVTAVTASHRHSFSNVTESSFSVSWSKPKTTFTGFRVTYTHTVTGESHFVTVDSRRSHVTLSKLSAGSSYIISVTATQGRTQSDALTSVITTVPAPPTHLQVVSVTDTRAVLRWTPSLGKVDRFIISYESSKTPNVTVTVMLSGNSVEHQLRGLQRGTLYTVKVLSQKDSLQSAAVSTTFTTASVVKASDVGPRSAVITWRSPTVVYHSYRVTYQVAGEEKKEVVLDPTITEYKMMGLLPMSRYLVLVQGERNGQYTSVVTSEFITGKLRFPFPTECSQELLNGVVQSGEADIYPQGKEGQAVRVYCDMETDGGGWTVFQRRMNGKTDFYRTWSEYSTGFGNLSEEFWLGNELLHNLTGVTPVSLRVDMQFRNVSAYAHYANFSVESEQKHFALSVSGYTGTAGDSMKYHNGRPFSTRDKDPDSLGIHCAKAYMGGWWYKNCYKTNLNGLYGMNSNNQGIVWIDWKGKDSSIPFTEMKLRPSRFSPATHG